jgi:hypothetical protein
MFCAYNIIILGGKMNSIKEKINNVLNNFDNEFISIKNCAKKYLKYCSIIDIDNSIKIGHNPVIAPENYMIVLYEGIIKSWINKFQNNIKIKIPEMYQNTLLKMNGCFIFDMSLYGLTPSLYNNKLLDRTKLQCLSLDIANTDWIKEYDVDTKYFYFGGRSYNENENIGYFIVDDKIKTLLWSGRIINEYKNFKDFLIEEIRIAEEMYLKANKIEELC